MSFLRAQSRLWAGRVFAAVYSAAAAAACADDPELHLDLVLTTGATLSGAVANATDHGLVLVRATTPYVFAWSELESGSAYQARRAIRAHERGGPDRLNSHDRFELGLFALSRGRNDLAAYDFAAVRRMGGGYEARIEEALAEFRAAQHRLKAEKNLASAEEHPSGGSGPGIDAAPMNDPLSEFAFNQAAGGLSATPEEVRAAVLKAYRAFGETVVKVMGGQTVLVESEHFLIWTDWSKYDRDHLVVWAEAMYVELCNQFGIPSDQSVFLAKCPIFCWGSRSQFRKFARTFDGFDARDAEGYTRSIERNGHVHVVLLRNDRTPESRDRFACTLVHEGTHAFIHRMGGSRLIPHWVNEGIAEMAADRVLGDRCPSLGNALLLSSEVARRGWSLGGLLPNSGPIEVQAYPIAHSVVLYLESQNRAAFARFIFGLKSGLTLVEALAESFDGLSPDELEKRWRQWAIREPTQPAPPTALQTDTSTDR